MGRFVAWMSHREPSSARLTGFWGLFAENDFSAQISAHGFKPTPGSDRQHDYKNMIRRLGQALLDFVNTPDTIEERQPPISALDLSAAPYALPPALGAQADAVNGGVEVTLFSVVPGQGPAPVPIRVRLLPQTALLLGEQMKTEAAKAELQGG